MSTIKHKRSITPGAVPQLAEFDVGEILINSYDGKAFIKRTTSGGSSIVEFRNTRSNVRATGQTGEENVSESGIRAALNELSDGIIPNYFVTNLAEFIVAYNAIRANYQGGNIYITGDIVMSSDLLLDLRGISIIGSYCRWRHYNGVAENPPASSVYKIIITRGSPTFRNITFYGSSGQSSIDMGAGTSRLFMAYNTVYTSEIVAVNFEGCNFYDVIGGNVSPVIDVPCNMALNAGITFNFRNCIVSSHNNGQMMEYSPFLITHSFDNPSTTNIRVSVSGHEVGSNTIKSTSRGFDFIAQNQGTSFAFHHDETAYTLAEHITETNVITEALLTSNYELSGLDDNGYMLITAGGTIYRVNANQFINAVIGGSGYTHPSGFTSQPSLSPLPGLEVISQITVNNEGHITGIVTKTLDVDKYEKFRIAFQDGALNGYSDCVGANGTLPPGSSRGLKLVAGSNISFSPNIDLQGLLNITISSAPSSPTGIPYFSQALLSSMSPIAANTWVSVTGLYIALDNAGTYLINAQVHLYRSGTGTHLVAARIYTPSGSASAAEAAPPSLSVNRLSLHLSAIVVVSGKSWVDLQVWCNTAAAWGVSGSTISSSQAGATQMNVIKIG